MASVFSHPAVVLGLAPVFARARLPPRVWALGAACAVLPDIDAIGFHYGIPTRDLFGHRGITHSLAFAALTAFLLAALLFRGQAWRGRRSIAGIFLFLCAATHGFLDAMTNGGPGVAFFAPFDAGRHFLPFRPIAVSPIGARGFFGPRGLVILRTELLWVWLPSLAVGLAAAAVAKYPVNRSGYRTNS